jgi:tetratricopeptide (TPR) repeat protein
LRSRGIARKLKESASCRDDCWFGLARNAPIRFSYRQQSTPEVLLSIRVATVIFRSAVCLALLSTAALAESRATLDVNETLFTVVSAMNVCGYDQELQSSSPIRLEVRADLVEASKSPAAAAAAKEMCQFYRDHQQGDAAHDLAQYVSLALNLGPPPNFAPKVLESDMPPDASYVLGFVPLLKAYYAAANLHAIWQKHEREYSALIDQYHQPVAQMIQSVDNYLRMPMSGFEGRSYTVYLEPMSAPGQVNSRNYAQDYYYLVVSPAANNLHMEALRHTYLHFVLDPLVNRRGTSLEKLKPIELSLQSAPMAEEYKHDTGLLVIECLIRAIEARTPADPKLPEKDRLALVQQDEAQGFALTGYFYNQLRDFEKGGAGLQSAFPDWLHAIDVGREKKHASQIAFAAQASPEVMQATKRASQNQKKIDLAERALASGNPAEAGKLAQDSLQANEDVPRAYFVLAKVASLGGQMQDAQADFQKALDGAKDPHVIAWAHIYLGRILDIQEERDSAVAQYKAALATNDVPPDAKRAAERGLQEPYQTPQAKHETQ